MEPDRNYGKLKNTRFYIIKSLKFFDLKNEHLTPVVFMIILAVSFSSVFLPEGEGYVRTMGILYSLLSATIIFLTSAVYLTAYIKELKGEEYSLGYCVRLVAGSAFRIIFVSFSYIFTVVVSFVMFFPDMWLFSLILVFFIPAIILYVMFIFNTCIAVDSKKGVYEIYRTGKNMTDRKKGKVFGIILLFNLILGIPFIYIITIAAFSDNILVHTFVLSFAAAIINLMQQRLIALIYMDLVYIKDN